MAIFGPGSVFHAKQMLAMDSESWKTPSLTPRLVLKAAVKNEALGTLFHLGTWQNLKIYPSRIKKKLVAKKKKKKKKEKNNVPRGSFLTFSNSYPLTIYWQKKMTKFHIALCCMKGVKLGGFHDSKSIASICFAWKTLPGPRMALGSIIFVMSHHIWDEGWEELCPFLAQGMLFMQNKWLQWIQLEQVDGCHSVLQELI